jgi:hypothetical protein
VEEMKKSQIPNPKFQGNPKHQASNTTQVEVALGFGVWGFPGVWDFGFGIFTP